MYDWVTICSVEPTNSQKDREEQFGSAFDCRVCRTPFFTWTIRGSVHFDLGQVQSRTLSKTSLLIAGPEKVFSFKWDVSINLNRSFSLSCMITSVGVMQHWKCRFLSFQTCFWVCKTSINIKFAMIF